VRLRCVINDNDLYAGRLERARKALKLAQRCRLLLLRRRIRPDLKFIGPGRERVALEAHRSNHQNT
jgi:hypothetical protein